MKKIYLLLLIIIVTGCSANYNLTIDNDYIDENIMITVPISSSDEELFYSQTSFLNNVYYGKDDIYESSISDDDYNYYANYKFKHKISDYGDSKFIVKCFTSNKIADDEDNIYFETSKGFNCIEMEDGAYLDEVVFNISTPLKVIDNNADKVSGNTYTWIFNDNNYKDKSVILHLKKVTMNEGNRKILIIFLIIIVCVLVLILAFFMNVRRKMSESNDL